MRLLKNPKFNFMDLRKTGFLLSSILIGASLVSLVLHGGPKFGIDFRGGKFAEFRFEDKADSTAQVNVAIEQVRKSLDDMNIGANEVKTFGTQEIAVQFDEASDLGEENMTKIISGLEQATGNNVELRRTETVGPKIGRELVWSALIAILISMGLILVYIMFRFELRFGVGAVAALAHDITITLGIFSIFDIEITVPIIAAVLTIIGYSLNDTIVVFDRIRENLKTIKKRVSGYAALINRSINETLSRTIVTSGTTLIVVMVLYFYGGAIINDFAFALICGIIIGTYSSIFIASPILVEWEARKQAAPALAGKKK
ncbi:MAG: protein translocase subunit SecF [Calditrichota bacterium]